MTRKRSHETDDTSSSEKCDDDIFSSVDVDSTANTDDTSIEEDHSELAEFLADADNELPPEFYMQQLENLKDDDYKKVKYADGSLILLDRVEENWHRFCGYIRKDPIKSYEGLNVVMCHTFLEWVLNQKRGKDGRLLKGIKVQSSLHTFWKLFRLVYERVKTHKIADDISFKMQQVLRDLAAKYKLSKKGREKPTMYVEDLAIVVETAISTTRKKFGHGRHRIELCLFLQLAALTANRPGAILQLYYRHIQVTILRDPLGGPNRILIEFTFEFTKTFLGTKDGLKFILPEIIFDPSLVLSPHVFLLSLLFADRAFKRWDGKEQLVSAAQLLHLDIPPGCNELQLLLKPELDNIPVFRPSDRTLQGIEISKDLPLPYSTLLPWVKTVGEFTGFRQVTRPYNLRRGAGKALDNSDAVSDSLRNLMMHHADTRTFLKYYLSRTVDVDVAAEIRQQDPEQKETVTPQTDIMRAACRMSRTIDPNRPLRLTTEQSSSVNELPEIQKLIRQRKGLRHRLVGPMRLHIGTSDYEQYQKLNKRLAGARQKARSELLERIKNDYDQEQPMREVELQLRLASENLSKAELQQQLQVARAKFTQAVNNSLEQSEELPSPLKRFAEAVLSLPGATLEEEMLRRTEAIDAGTAVCLFEEGDTSRIAHNKRQKKTSEVDVLSHKAVDSETSYTQSLQEMKLQQAMQSVSEDTRPKYCFICVGNTKLDYRKRTQTFKEHGDVTKHIRRSHLKHITQGDELICVICGNTFPNTMSFKRHAIETHSTVT